MLGGFKSTIVFSERLLVCEFDVPTIYTGTLPLTRFSNTVFSSAKTVLSLCKKLSLFRIRY